MVENHEHPCKPKFDKIIDLVCESSKELFKLQSLILKVIKSEKVLPEWSELLDNIPYNRDGLHGSITSGRIIELISMNTEMTKKLIEELKK
jgi:hypothetical protein